MRTETRRSYEERMTEVLTHILTHLDDPLNAVELADLAYFSTYHFHRIFRGMVGESVGEFVRRVRLERAAIRMCEGGSVTEAAFDSGYESLEAFTRMFRATYGYAPTEYRRLGRADHRLPCPSGVHFDPSGRSFMLRSQAGGIAKMEIEIREKPAFRVVAMRHTGPYYMVGEAFGRLSGWVAQNGVPWGNTVGIYHDNPEITPLAELRSDAGMIVPDDFETKDEAVSVIDVPANRYAVMTYRGAYDGLGNAWNQLCGEWFPSSGNEFGSGPCFEIYLTDCSQVPPDQLVTEIYQPVG